MKKIKNPKDLPPEFNLKKYAHLANLTTSEWETNLHELFMIYESIKAGYKDKNKEDFGYGFGLLFDKSADSNKRASFDNSKKHTSSELTKIINTDTVEFLSIVNSLRIKKTIDTNNVLRNIVYYPKETTIDLNQALELYENRMLLTGKTQIPITIDILANEEQLVHDFKSFISSYRRILEISPPSPIIIPNEKNIKNWIRWRVIQFMDLRIWELLNDAKISYTLLGKTLFPDEYEKNTTDMVRNTVEPNAEKLMKEISNFYDQVGEVDDRSSYYW